MERFSGTQDALQAPLRRPVDLITVAGLKPRARLQVPRDLIAQPCFALDTSVIHDAAQHHAPKQLTHALQWRERQRD